MIKQARRPPLTLMHGDLHTDNIFLPSTRGGRFASFDLQSLAVSHLGTYDVARLLCMGIRPEQRRAHERMLLSHYNRAQCAHGVRDYSLRRLRMHYRQEPVAAKQAYPASDASSYAYPRVLYVVQLSSDTRCGASAA